VGDSLLCVAISPGVGIEPGFFWLSLIFLCWATVAPPPKKCYKVCIISKISSPPPPQNVII
jgi:hypothetical protein